MKMDRADLKDLDKSTWSTFRFDQIASSISERVDPNETDLKHYIGLEHLDSENIHITRMGTPDDVNGQKLRCYPGDVIFGRRRAYQRKAAVCEVNGFCSAHSLVLRANPHVIDPKLFPFFLHSDSFMHRAVDISVGSLSPTINWKTLREQEFLLPPKSQQADLIELLWAIDVVIEKAFFLNSSLISNTKALLENFIIERSSGDSSKLGEVGDWVSGGTPSKKEKAFWENQEILWITPKDMKADILDDSIDKLSCSAITNGKAKLFPKGSTVLVWRSGILQHSFPIARVGSDFTVNQDMKVFVPASTEFLGEYVRIYLTIFKEKLRRDCVKEGTTVQSVNTSVFMKQSIPKLPLPIQRELIEIENKCYESIQACSRQLDSSRSLKKSLINQVF